MRAAPEQFLVKLCELLKVPALVKLSYDLHV